jgi:hypothetical protein
MGNNGAIQRSTNGSPAGPSTSGCKASRTCTTAVCNVPAPVRSTTRLGASCNKASSGSASPTGQSPSRAGPCPSPAPRSSDKLRKIQHQQHTAIGQQGSPEQACHTPANRPDMGRSSRSVRSAKPSTSMPTCCCLTRHHQQLCHRAMPWHGAAGRATLTGATGVGYGPRETKASATAIGLDQSPRAAATLSVTASIGTPNRSSPRPHGNHGRDDGRAGQHQLHGGPVDRARWRATRGRLVPLPPPAPHPYPRPDRTGKSPR